MKGKSDDKRGQKPKPVLADHKRVGKKFLPPMAQLGLSDVRWVESLAPEFLWLALLHDRLGFARGAEVACVVADSFKSAAPSLGWCGAMSTFQRLPEAARPAFVSDLAARAVRDELRLALRDLHAHYPFHPLAFVMGDEATGDLSTLKRVVASLIGWRSDVEAMRAQATAVYLALKGGWLHVRSDSALADFREVERYPDTEKSQRVASSVRATLNVLTIQIAPTDWPRYFWNRGLELEACSTAGEE